MSLDDRFQFLPSPTAQFFLSPINPSGGEVVELYIDSLCLLHDLVVQFIPEAQRERFEKGSEINTWVEECLSHLSFLSSNRQYLTHAETLRNNIVENWNLAKELRKEFLSGKRQVTRHLARQYVHNYVDDLLEQYKLVRYPSLYK